MRLSQRVVIKYIRTKFKLLSAISKRKSAEKAFQLFCTPQRRTRKKLPSLFLKAEKLNFKFIKTKIRGYRWNHKSGKKVLILHGYESSVVNFEMYIKPLMGKGYEVVAFDAPAHGRSGGKMINVLQYRDFILHVEKEFGPFDGFIAHSLGGLSLGIALESMPNAESKKAVLIAPATETMTAINAFFKFMQLDDDVRTEFDLIIEEQSSYKPQWFSVARAAQNIKASVLWLHDEEDKLTPLSDVKPVIDKSYPNFQFLISKGLGHRQIYKDIKSANAIIDFL